MRRVTGCSAPRRRATWRLFQLVFERQSVTRLDLYRSDAFGQQRVKAGQGGIIEAVGTGGAGRHDRGADAAAGARDFFVACAFQPQFELACPIAAVDQVGVAVGQAGRDPGAIQFA